MICKCHHDSTNHIGEGYGSCELCSCEAYVDIASIHEQILGRPGPLTAPISYGSRGIDANSVVTMTVHEGNTIKVVTIGVVVAMKELKALGRILLHHNIAYDDPEAKEIVDKIFRILKENENGS